MKYPCITTLSSITFLILVLCGAGRAAECTATEDDGAEMILIPSGEFLMGSPENVGYPQERPQKRIFLDAFYMDKYPVTVEQYRRFCKATGRDMPPEPAWGWIESHPVVNVTWEEASAYAAYYGKRLPTEAEWEKACRAGSATIFHFGDDWSDLGKYAWYTENSAGTTRPVGTREPNAYGLHDMHGNVWEWCSDWYDSNYYSADERPSENPQGPSRGHYRVLRGGAWNTVPDYCRSAFRAPVNQDVHRIRFPFLRGVIGFRCARDISE